MTQTSSEVDNPHPKEAGRTQALLPGTGEKMLTVTDYITLQTWWIRKAGWWAKCLLCMSKRFLRCHERHSKACRHDRWVIKLRLLVRSEAVLLFMLLLLVCDGHQRQVMLHMMTEYMERAKQIRQSTTATVLCKKWPPTN